MVKNTIIQVNAWYKVIKTDGYDFHCFLCNCDISGTRNAVEHAFGSRHELQCKLSGIKVPNNIIMNNLVDLLDRNYVSTNDINSIIGYDVNFYMIGINGDIYCRGCKLDVPITDLKNHNLINHKLPVNCDNKFNNWYKDVKTDGNYYYCFLCRLKLGNEMNALEHTIGSFHAESCNASGIIIPNDLEYIYLKNKLKLNFVVDNDLCTLLGDKTATQLRIENNGVINCNICKNTVNILSVEDHVKSSEHTKKLKPCDLSNFFRHIKTDGASFHCFLCNCDISEIKNAVSHAISFNHIIMCKSSGINIPTDVDIDVFYHLLQKNYVTIDDISSVVNVNIFKVDHKGSIHCNQCETHVPLINLQNHCSMCDTVYTRIKKLCKKVKTDGVHFFCFQCQSKLNSKLNAAQHINGHRHIQACNLFDIRGIKYRDLRKEFELNFVTQNDLNALLKEKSFVFEIGNNGRINCTICKHNVNIMDVVDHAESKKHTDKIVYNSKLSIKWYSFIKTDGYDFHCFLCHCYISGLENAQSHARGRNHLTKCRQSQINVPDYVNIDLSDLLDKNYIAIDDIRLLIGNDVVLYNVELEGKIFCKKCKENVFLINLEDHNHSSNHKHEILCLNDVSSNWCNSVKTDGISFFCFLCRCKLSTSSNAEEHVRGKLHKKSCKEVNIVVPDGIENTSTQYVSRLNFVTTDDLKSILSEDALNFDVKSSGTIYCKKCEYNVNIIDIEHHVTIKKHVQKTLHSVELSDDWYSVIKTDGLYFYCFICQCDISGIENAKLHAKGESHTATCVSRGIYFPENVEVIDLHYKLKTNYLNTDDIGLYAGYTGRFYAVNKAGKVYCTNCQDYIGVGNLNGHINSLAHKKLITDSSDDWYKYVKTDGVKFYCFLCYSELNDESIAESHIMSNVHISKCKLLDIIMPLNLDDFPIINKIKSNFVDKNELIFILGNKVSMLTVRNNGQIYCNTCNERISIADVKTHFNKSKNFKKSSEVGKSVNHWLDPIKTDGFEFYCFLCFCGIPGIDNVEQHLRGSNHISKCTLSGTSALKMTNSVNLHSQLIKNNITIEDITLIVGHAITYYSIKSTGNIYCELCNCSVRISKIKKHEEIIHKSKTLHLPVQMNDDFYKDIKTDGNLFYCFLCKYKLFSVYHAVFHVKHETHIKKCELININVPKSVQYISIKRKLQLNFVTTDDLALILGKNSCYEITSDHKIYCKVCESNINIDEIYFHIKKWKHIKKISNLPKSSNHLYKQIKTDGTCFYCFLCDCYVSGLDDAQLHAKSDSHLSKCSLSVKNLPNNEVIDLQFKLQSNYVTIEDVSLLTGNDVAITFYTVDSTGKIFCKTCACDVSLDQLNSHTMDYHCF